MVRGFLRLGHRDFFFAKGRAQLDWL